MMSFIRYYLTICIVACLCFGINAFAQDASAVLENLKRCDSIYESGFTASGTLKGTEKLCRLVPIEVERSWKLTYDGGRTGYLSEVVKHEKPKFYEPGRRTGGSLNKDGWLVVGLRTKHWDYCGEDSSGSYMVDTVMKISPENDVVETGKTRDASIWPATKGPGSNRRKVLWSLGRSLSRYIDEVTDVKEPANGRIAVSALGKRGSLRGRWELEIEPAAAWMVRHARFYADVNPELINCEMKNSGSVWSGSYCIPKKVLFNNNGPIDGGKEHELRELTIDPVIKQFDEELLDGAKRAVTIDRPPNLTIYDHRVSPTLIFKPDRLADIASDKGLDYVISNDKLVDAAKPVVKGENVVTIASRPDESVTNPFVQSAPVAPLAQRPWYLLPEKWAVFVLILAVVIAGCACLFLFKVKSREN